LIAVTSPEGADIYHLPNAYLRIIDVDNMQSLFYYDLQTAASQGTSQGRLLCKLTRNTLSRWTFTALDEPVNGRVYHQVANDVQHCLMAQPATRTFSVRVHEAQFTLNPEHTGNNTLMNKKVSLVYSAYFDDEHSTSKVQKATVTADFVVTFKDELKVWHQRMEFNNITSSDTTAVTPTQFVVAVVVVGDRRCFGTANLDSKWEIKSALGFQARWSWY
jgi:hypothetical protein